MFFGSPKRNRGLTAFRKFPTAGKAHRPPEQNHRLLRSTEATCWIDSPSLDGRYPDGLERDACWLAVKQRQLQRMQASPLKLLHTRLSRTCTFMYRNPSRTVHTSHISLAFCCETTKSNLRKMLRQLDKSHNPIVGRRSKQLCIIRSANYVRSCKYDLRKPDRSTRTAYSMWHLMPCVACIADSANHCKDPKVGEKASGSDLTAEYSHMCIAFSIAFCFDPTAPNQTTTLAKM